VPISSAIYFLVLLIIEPPNILMKRYHKTISFMTSPLFYNLIHKRSNVFLRFNNAFPIDIKSDERYTIAWYIVL